MKKTKIKEINLNPDYTLASAPMQSRFKSHNGGMTMSADSHHARNVVQRVNKGYEESEEEELDEFVEDLNLLKEFLATPLDTLFGIGKTAFMSVPGIGDAFALGKFITSMYTLRVASTAFTKKLSELTSTSPEDKSTYLGNDFLEPENIEPDTLDQNLAEAAYRIKNLESWNREQELLNNPKLELSIEDVRELKSEFNNVCRIVKNCIMEFLGFADFAVGQKFAIINLGITGISHTQIPDWIVGSYASALADIELKAQARARRNQEDYFDLSTFLYEAAKKVIAVPGALGDFMGNLDLMLNMEKLQRLAVVHDTLKHYDPIDTNEEYYEQGLSAERGTDYERFLSSKIDKEKPEDVFSSMAGFDMSDLESNPTKLDLSEYRPYLRENYSLSELYDNMFNEEDAIDDDEDGVDEVSVAGGIAIGTLPLGSATSDGKGRHSSKEGGRVFPYGKKSAKKAHQVAKRSFGHKK